MRQLVVAGLLYLIVTATVLTIKPNLMFTEGGDWKEFGIGRNPATHTWLPFWLFSVLSALVCYILVVLIFSLYNIRGNMETPTIPNLTSQSSAEATAVTPDDLSAEMTAKRTARLRGKASELPEGYYVLNTNATEEAGGVPKYIYLGKGLPSD